MKNRLLAFCLAIACLSAVSAQSPLPPEQQPPRPWGEKLFGDPTNLIHDFGTVPRGMQLHHDFVLTNIYAVPIEITNVRVSGMAPMWARMPKKRTLQPNESATISVNLDGRYFTGHKEVACYVTVGGDYFSEARMTVRTTVRQDLVCTPGEAAFGSVAPGKTPSVTVDFEHVGQPDWEISDIMVPKNAPFEATVKRIDSDGENAKSQVKVTLKKDAPLGQFFERITLRTNDPTCELISLVVRGNIQEPLAVEPATINLGNVKSEEEFKRRVLIKSAKPFKVTGVYGPDLRFELDRFPVPPTIDPPIVERTSPPPTVVPPIDEKVAEVHSPYSVSNPVRLGEPPLTTDSRSVELAITAPAKEGLFRYEVTIRTDAHDEPVMVVIEGVVSKK